MESSAEDKNGGAPLSNRELRAERKQKRLLAEFKLTQSNDVMKRPGELLDSKDAKKIKIVEPQEGERLNPEEFKKLKKLLNERKKILKQLPRFLLQGAGLSAELSVAHDVREPIFMSDIQQLLLYGLCGNQIVFPPTRWCSLEKANRLNHVVTLVVEGITSEDFVLNEHLFPKLTQHFQNRVEFMAPSYYGRDIVQELSCIPLTNSQKEAILQKWGSMEKAINEKDIVKQYRPLFPTCSKVKQDIQIDTVADLPKADVFPRTYLLLGLNQMAYEGYPMPYWSTVTSKYSDFKLSKLEYDEVSSHSPMFGIDCEMVLTSKGRSELARIAVVNENLEVVYESLVKPENPVTNYLTQFSGITEKILMDVTTTLEDVQDNLRKVLPADAIIVGHSLNYDLAAIKIMHPYVIDTSVIYNLKGAPHMKSKLSTLSEHFLKESIQTSKQGHCPIEDAKATMKLVKMKLAQGFLFGDITVASSDQPTVPESILTSSIFNRVYKFKKTVTVIGPDRIIKEYENVTSTPPDGTAFTPIIVSKNKEVITKICEVATSHQLTIAHLDVSDQIKENPDASSSSTLSKKKEKILKKVDEWCDTVFSHVSLNGMCVITFAGPKHFVSASDASKKSISKESNGSVKGQDKSQSKLCDIPSASSKSSSKSLKKQASLSQNQSEEDNLSSPIPRRNGVCFIQVNTKKI